MKKLGWLSLFLVLSPVLAFVGLLLIGPAVGNPQDTGDPLVQFLDYQLTYFMRERMPFPPPLPAVGLVLSVYLWKCHDDKVARVAAHFGLLFFAFWAMITLVPLMIKIG
jgi:hypothetical protein